MSSLLRRPISTAKDQIRAILIALKLIPPDHDGEQLDPNEDWTARAEKGPWSVVYKEVAYRHEGHTYTSFELDVRETDGSLLWISFEDETDDEDDATVAQTWDIRLSPDPSESDPARLAHWQRLVSQAWCELEQTLQLERLIPTWERHNPCSPYMLGTLVRILNWFAQLPDGQPEEPPVPQASA